MIMSTFSLSSVYAQLTSFANLENFWSLFDTAFGSSYDFATAASFRSQWQSGDFSLFPQIEIVSSDVLGSANGAYAISTNRIYLSDQFVNRASQQSLEAVILEEFGHFVDAQVNQTDTAGDEGELFSAIVRGVSLSAAELSRVKAEDDHAVIVVNGQSVAVEQAATLVGVWDRLSTAVAVTVVGNYAYAVGDTLEIIDISDPSNPIFKGGYDISDGRDIQIVGNYAYIADGSSGLQIIDISNPTAPTLKGNYNTSGYDRYARGVSVVGNYAYIADGSSRLQIIDISNPTAPTLKGTYNTSGRAFGVQVIGNYAYVADASSGLQIIDISNPTAPTLKGKATYNTSGYYDGGVQVVGNYAYVADTSSGLQIIDISNPTAPILKVTYKTPHWAQNVQIVGNYAYVADTAAGLTIIDISNPTAPILKATYKTPADVQAKDVHLVGNYAYVAETFSGLQIIDISNSTAPTLKGIYNTSSWAKNVQIVGNYAYVASGNSGLQIIDISNPTAPILKGTYDTPGFALDVQLVGNYAYVADNDSGLQIIDISNPTAPIFKGTYNTSYTWGVSVVGNYAYVASLFSGLRIIDISNPTAPTFKGGYGTSDYTYDVEVVGNYAYIAAHNSGLQIIDISNPTAPTLKGSYNTSGSARGVSVVGTYAYVADIGSGLQIIDISNPTAPIFKGSYDTPGEVFGVQVVGNYAYVTDRNSGLQIIDISNPTAPILKGSYDTSGLAVGVSVVGNYAYVADSDGGLKIIDVSEFTNISVNQSPTDLAISNNTIAENQSVGTAIGTFTSTDPDTGNSFTYSLVTGTGDTDNALFTITDNQLQTNAIFDYETQHSYSIRVKTTDQSGLFFEKSLTINVNDLNDPTIVTVPMTVQAIGEDSFSPLVFSSANGNAITLSDQDAGNSLFTVNLSLLDYDYWMPFFSIGKLYLGNTQDLSSYFYHSELDTYASVSFSGTIAAINNALEGLAFSPSMHANGSANLLIWGQDENYNSLPSLMIPIHVYPVNDAPQLLFNFTTQQVNENEAFSFDIQLSDLPDNDGVILTATAKLSNGDALPSWISVNNNYNNLSLDFSGTPPQGSHGNLDIVVSVSDGELFTSETFTLNVVSANNAPTELALSNSNIVENQAVGTTVGTFTSTDPDTGNTFTYSLVTGTGDTDNALFTITDNQLQSNGIFDFETRNSYSIRVKTTDQGGLTFEKQLTIGVTDINETPTDLTLFNTSIAENQAVGTTVGALISTDPDTVKIFTYSLVTGTGDTDNALFAIAGDQLKTNAIFDYETKNSYSIRVKTTDQGGLTFEKQLTIGVTYLGATLVGKWDRLTSTYGVTVVGNYAYVVGDNLEIIDISNPSSPVFVGTYEFTVTQNTWDPWLGLDVQIVGNYAYVATQSSGLQILDISNPANPILKGTYDTPDSASAVKVIDNYAYVADNGSGLQIIDITNPSNPTLKGTYNTSGSAYAVEVVGNYAYVADAHSGLQIIDISNPTAPTLKGNYDTSGWAWGVQVVGNYAYVADGGSGLQIIDISNPALPLLKATYKPDDYFSIENVKVSGNYTYAGGHVIDISNPLNPIKKSNYSNSSYGDIEVSGNNLYNANFWDGLKILDISNSAVPIAKGSYNLSIAGSVSVWVLNNYAYVGKNYSGVQIFDISNPSSPVLKSNYGSYNSNSGSFNATEVEVVGNYAYIASWDKGLKILDISNPNNPISKATLAIPGQSAFTTGLQVVGNYAYVMNINSGLSIIDITNPTAPSIKGNYAGQGYDVQVIGNYAYIPNGYSGLQIVNISNPTTPTLISNFLGSGSYGQRGIEVVGNYAYVASETQGLLIIDISNPSAPSLKGTYNTPGDATRVSVVGNYAYVADGTYGLQIINISNPTNPTLAGSYDTSGSATDVKVIGNYAYVADNVGGLKIIDVSELLPSNQAPTNLALSNGNIAENQAIGTAIGTFTTTDPDTGNTFTYSLVTGTGSTDNALFAITGNQLQSNGIFDFETQNSYSIRVKTTDQDGLTFEKELTIGVANINETPTNLTLSNTSIVENQAIGTAIGTFTSTDPDTGNTFTYSLVTGIGATDNALFTITDNQLRTNTIFNFETKKNSYSIRVKTTDQDGLTFEKQLTIGVTNINETPTNLRLSNTSIAENKAIGTAIGTFTTIDPDTANTFTYSLVTGTGATDNAFFTITGNQLRTNAILDYETQNSYSIRVRTTDQGGLFFEKELIISATNVNEGTLSFSASQFSINEDGTSVNQITINRAGGSTGEVSVTLNLTDDTASAGSDYDGTPIAVTFADGETSKTVIIPLVDDLIFENDENFNVTLTNPTGGATLGNQTIATVKIIDGGDTKQYASSVIAFSSEGSSSLWSAEQTLGQPDTSVYEDSPTSWSALSSNADGDPDADEFITVGFSTPVYANSIEIRETYGNGFVRSIDLLDNQDVYHSVWVGIDPSQPGEPVNFRVNFERTTYLVVGARINVDIDHNLGTWEEIDSVKLFGVSNYSPTNLTLSNTSIAENQAVGTSIGTFTTIDPDADNTFTYSLVTGAGDTDNALFTITDNQLQTNGIFDYETQNSYSIRVRTTDQDGLTFEKQLTIGVTNINETPTELTLPNTSIAENQAVGTTVGTFTSTDPDTGNTFAYSLVTGIGSTDNALFAIAGNQLQTNAIFDYETKNSYSIRVKTTDQGGLTFEKQLTIGVTDINETPTDLTLSNTSIAENQAVGTTVGTFTSTDPDTGNTFTYSLVTGTGSTDNALFAIAGDQLQSNGIFDFETKNSYSIRVKTTDQDGLTFEKQLTIGVTNINETPTDLTLSNTSIAENQAVGTTVGTFTSTDPDTGNSFTYSLVTGTGDTDNALLTVVGNQLRSNGIFDFEIKNSYSIRVKTTDQGGLSYEKALTININDVQPTITLAVSPNTVSEDGSPNLLYTFIRDNDLGNSLTVNYALTGTATNGTDYTSIGTSVTFAANSNTATLTIDPTADTTIENDETVALTLATGTGYTIGTTAAVIGTITNDDFPSITLTLAPVSVSEDGTTNLVYTFTRTGLTTNALTVNYGIAGTADATDYTGATPGTGKTITFAANSATATLTIDPTADALVENNETVALTLATGTGYTIGTTTAVTGTISNDDTAIESIGNTKLLKDGTNKYLAQVGNNTPVAIKNSTIHIYEGMYAGWQTLAVETVNGVNQVLWTNAGSNIMHVWQMNSNWERTSTQSITLNSSAGFTQETVFGVDANGDGVIGSPPSITLAVAPVSVSEDGTANLVYTFTRTGLTTNPLTVNYSIAGIADVTDYTGATPGTGKTITFAVGSATAILTIDPSADAFVENNETVALTLATGTGYTIGTTTAVTGTITNDDTAIEIAGDTKLLKDGANKYFAQVGSNMPVAIKNSTAHIYEGMYAGWQILAVENVNGVNQVLWTNAGSNTMHVWQMNSSWERVSTQSITLNSSAGFTQETVFGVDANGDGTIGISYTTVESVGNTKIVKDSSNKYFAQVGNNTPVAIKDGTTQIYEGIYAGWQTLAAETVNGVNQVLWTNAGSNAMHVWQMNTSWERVSTQSITLNSAAALAQETVFGVDANGDGSIGNPNSLTLTGTSGNDTLVGGANNDVLTGLGGKDRLTGGLRSDRFSYKILTDSLLANFDVITDFNTNANNDLFLVTTVRTGFTNAGAVATLDNAGIIAKLTTANFGANSAASFTFGTRTFVAINDATAGFSQTTDAIIEITGLTGILGIGNFVIA
jgi:hypothetical protein